MKKHLLLIISIFLAHISFAQNPFEVNGTVKDSTGNTVIGAAVKLTSSKDTTTAITNVDGKFVFKSVKSAQFNVTITALGYKTLRKPYNLGNNKSPFSVGTITLANDSKMLGEVVVDGTPDIIVKEDTLQFRADKYNLRDNALAEDLLKKLPGVEVDRDGNVTTQGKQVTRVRINGKDFFGGDVKTATQQLPADVLENVQIIDYYGDQASLTGIKDGEPEKILNFTIRPDKNKGFLTRGTVGAGTKDRYQASVFSAKFNNAQQISVLANLNNTNANIFSLTSGNTNSRGGRGGFNGGNSDGLTNVKSLGLNYRDEWGKKVTAYGSYSISGRDNNVFNNVFQRNLFQDQILDNTEETNANNNSTSHRFDFNIEYKIDSLNYLKISPRVNYTVSDGEEHVDFDILNPNPLLSSNGTKQNLSNSKSPNLGADILYNHRFGAKARNLTLGATFNSSSSDNNQDNINKSIIDPTGTASEKYQHQVINNDNTNDNISLRASYSEPLSATKNLEFNYEYGYSDINNKRTVLNSYDENQAPSFLADQSNEYKFNFTTNRFGLNYRVREQKYNYTIGLGVQPSVLEGYSASKNINTKQSAVNIFPTGRFVYRFSRSKELNFNYNGRSNQPSYNQLQPITDKSDPQFPVTGNPNLEAEFTNNFNVRYNNFNSTNGTSIFTNVSYNFTKDKIVTNSISPNLAEAEDGVIQKTEYLNANGYYSLNGFYSFNKEINEKKYVIGLRGFANYNNNISFIESDKNTGKNLVLNQRLQVQIRPKEWLELVPALSYTYNKNDNSVNKRTNTEINTYSLAFDSKIYFTKTFLWGSQADKSFNNGYNDIAVNPFIINTYLEKQFFKGNTGALRLTAFDLLDENTSITRTVNANGSIVDRRSNRLSRYLMLTFTMRFNKFAGKSNPVDEGNRERWGGGERGPRPF